MQDSTRPGVWAGCPSLPWSSVCSGEAGDAHQMASGSGRVGSLLDIELKLGLRMVRAKMKLVF